METLMKPRVLQKYLKKYKIPDMFDTTDIEYYLLHFNKGEQIISPLKKLNQILFHVEGTAHIYGIRMDGSYSPVTVQTPLTIYGDMEFATGQISTFFVEAQNDVLCIAISLLQYEEVLRNDVRFLNGLLKSVADKLSNASSIETASTSLEERLLFLMENFCEDGCIHSVNDTIMHLRCSRRQLQRVLSKLCEDGRIEKVGKGHYRLMTGKEK